MQHIPQNAPRVEGTILTFPFGEERRFYWGEHIVGLVPVVSLQLTRRTSV